MTSPHIVDQGRVHLDGFDYKIIGPVVSSLGSRFAPKQVIGQTTMDSHEDISYLRWDDFTGGIGLSQFFSNGGAAPSRAWFSDCDLSQVGHITLGPRAIATTSVEGTFFTPNVDQDSPKLFIFKNELYMVLRNTVATVDRMRIYKYDDSGNSWGSALHTFPGNIQLADAVTGFIGGTEYAVVSTTTSYAYSTDGTTWTDDTADVSKMCIHDDALWGVDFAGNFWSATTPGTEVSKSSLPIPAVASSATPYVSQLRSIPDASGDPRIHASTAYGLYFYDQTQDKWTKSNIALPEAKYNGRGLVLWNGDIYISSGMGLWKAVYGATTALFPVGPDNDNGLPAINRGAIIDLAPGHNILVAVLQGRFTGFKTFISDESTLRQLVMAYDGKGWQVLWQSGTSYEEPRSVIIGSAYNKYRLWFSTTTLTTANTVYYIDIPSERMDPHQAQTKEYASSCTLETPSYHVGEDVEGLAVSLIVEPHSTSSTETITVEYSVNDESYVTLGTITGDADYEYLFPSSTDISGVPFRSIQFRLTLARGATTTARPFVHSLTLKFFKSIPERQRHIITLDLTQEVGGQSPRDQWKNLRSTLRKRELVELTYRDEPEYESHERYWVRINQFQSRMATGLNYGGTVELELVEVQHPAIGGSWDVDNWDEFLWG